MTDPDFVVLSIADNGVATIELNRPDQRNALTTAAMAQLLSTIEECRGAAKVVILTGRGPAFCAGMDLKERAELDKNPAGPSPSSGGAMHVWIQIQDTIRRHPAIFIAAVNGHAFGGGVTLINTCDLALAAEDAMIGIPEVGFGMYPAMSGASTQMRILRKHAAWLILTAGRIDGRQAEQWGLVNRAVGADDLMPETLAVAERIAGFDAVTLDWTKKALWEIPMRISDYTLALEYGDHVALQIRTATSAVAEGLARFSAGERNPGQGAI